MLDVNAMVEDTSKVFSWPGSEECLRLDSPTRETRVEAPFSNHKGLSDEELIKRFVEESDHRAFDEIVDRYTDTTYRIAVRLVDDPTDAEEVLQEVLLTLVKKLDTFREESKFSTWLYRVVVNASYMHLRARRSRNENEMKLRAYIPYDQSGLLRGMVEQDWSAESDEFLQSREGMDIIENAVNQLPEHNRVVFQLRDVEGLSNEEVAKILGLSLPAVKSRIHRARLVLRDRLSDYFYEWRK